MTLQLLPSSGSWSHCSGWSHWHSALVPQPSGSLHSQECVSNSCVPTATLRKAEDTLARSPFLLTFPFRVLLPPPLIPSPPHPHPIADRLDDSVSPCISLQLGFEDLIAEPETTHSFDKVWICSHALFEISKYVIYKFLTVFLAIPLAFVAGILFATLSCLHIW